MKKFIAMLMTLCLALGCFACAGAEDEKTYTVGIIQLVQHTALDAATKGFRDALTEKLGDRVVFDEQNASGDTAACATIANGFVSAGVDLIMANATAALQAAVSATADIPILGTSISHYGTALDISDWKGYTELNVSGTSDLAPLDGQAAMIKELFPDAKKVGLLYCSAEANSAYQIGVIKGYLEELGFETEEYAFTDSNDVASMAQNATECDVIYIPTDNTAAAYTETIANVVLPAKTPVVAGEEGICAGCGVATLTISYYDLGYKTGEMAYDVLVNGADVSTMEIAFAPQFTKKYNAANCAELGITVPDDYEPIE
ncbi:MAG: ABC transporter substrate-binding protein [Clostridia bacterium]|nr:ABC transporter substrate-binding protein [Clostridia bacterium]